jgi:hypothetical protein
LAINVRAYWVPGGERRALRQCFELGPGDLRVNSTAETAIGGSDHPLPADDRQRADTLLRQQDRGGEPDRAAADNRTGTEIGKTNDSWSERVLRRSLPVGLNSAFQNSELKWTEKGGET